MNKVSDMRIEHQRLGPFHTSSILVAILPLPLARPEYLLQWKVPDCQSSTKDRIHCMVTVGHQNCVRSGCIPSRCLSSTMFELVVENCESAKSLLVPPFIPVSHRRIQMRDIEMGSL